MGRRPRPGKPARFTLRYATRTDTDLAVLGERDPALVDAALAAVDDLVHGRQRGKALGDRHATGDLSGLPRLRFDVPGTRPAMLSGRVSPPQRWHRG